MYIEESKNNNLNQHSSTQRRDKTTIMHTCIHIYINIYIFFKYLSLLYLYQRVYSIAHFRSITSLQHKENAFSQCLMLQENDVLARIF